MPATVAKKPAQRQSALSYFVTQVSRLTGLDPRVIVTWIQAEGAYAPGGTGHYNFLNLRPYQGDPYVHVSGGGFEEFKNVGDAVTATVRRIKQPFAVRIATSAREPALYQLQAIGISNWDSGHYSKNGVIGQKLIDNFTGLFGAGSLKTRQGPSTAAVVAATAGTGSGDIPAGFGEGFKGVAGIGIGAGEAAAGGAKAAATAAKNVAEAPLKIAEVVSGAFGKLTDASLWLRILEIAGGAVLVLAGLVLLARQIGLAPPAAGVAAPVVEAVG